MTSKACVFCEVVAGRAIGRGDVWRWPDAMAFEPLRPVTKGHVLVVPNAHVSDALSDPVVTAGVMARAAWLAQTVAPTCNLITSCGADASQSVMHLHIHIVPRREGDGLALPWTGQVPSDEGGDGGR